MNKVHCKIKGLFQILFLMCLILFNLSCGLDTFYVIDNPSLKIHEPQYSSIDPSSYYFEFYTAENTYNDIKFLGTDVYYKIYRNTARMENEYKSIISTAENTETAAQAPSRLIDTYKYKTLEANGFYSNSVLIPSIGVNRKITIRLSDYPPYNAQILVADQNAYGSSERVIPVRNIVNPSGALTFSFKNLPADLRPQKDDADVDYNGTGSDSEWYVAMFAVAVAQDANYSQVYSNVLFLGTVKISL